MKQIEREEMRREKPEPTAAASAQRHTFEDSPFAQKAGFAKFDLKTGTIVGGAAKAIEPKAAGSGRKEPLPDGYKPAEMHHQYCGREQRGSSAWIRAERVKTFTAPPRVVTRTAHRNMTLVRQVQKAQAVKQPVKISRVRSFWQKVKSFFAFGKKVTSG